jgi:hypothetical protein
VIISTTAAEFFVLNAEDAVFDKNRSKNIF